MTEPAPPYVELHAHSCYSLLDGASPPEALVARAAALGMEALALTDHDALYAAGPFTAAAQAAGIHPVLGAELTLADQSHLTLLVQNETGWANLCHLLTRARHHAPKGEARLPAGGLAGHTEGLIALSGCRRGAVAAALLRGDHAGARRAARRLQAHFAPGDFWIELQHHLRPEDDRLLGDLVRLARGLDLGLVATNNVHYAEREAHILQDVLVAIRHNLPLAAATSHLRPNSESYLKTGREIAPLIPLPGALAATRLLAERCHYTPPAGLQALPRFPTPWGRSSAAHLRHLCEQALRERLGEGNTEARRQLDHELDVIERCRLNNYFLVVWDVVRFAREAKIRCQGRGSACNSLVAYLLDISPINPLAHDLVFERFLSEERAAVPDIDLDLQADRREEVIQYVYQRYGPAHVAMACTFITYRARGALRDVGKALGIPPALLARISELLDGRGAEALAHSPELREQVARGELWEQLSTLAEQIQGYPRHLGLHNGGMVITRSPLTHRVPTEPATMADRTVVQWDKEMLEDAGLIKLDLLGLRMLSTLAEAAEWVEQERGQPLDLSRLPLDDPEIYAMISRADTVGLFQVESRAQAQMLPRLQPRRFEDLIIAISLIRPGPLQGNMVHPYLRRRSGVERVRYAHPLLEGALAETLGVVLFQEQVLKVARDLAGFSPGQGEQLRRTLGKDPGRMDRFRSAFVRGAAARDVPREAAEEVWEQLRAFGGYAFAKSHAAAFAVLVYQSAWLKRYHPAAFFAALLNHQPMGFWSPAVLVGDAKRHDVTVLPMDVNQSTPRCTVAGTTLRIGLTYVRGLGESGSARVIAARPPDGFTSLEEFCRRTRLPRSLVEKIILAGGMDGWGRPRRALLWDLGPLRYEEEELELHYPPDGVRLPPLSAVEAQTWERSVLGLATGDHLLSHYRDWLTEHHILDSDALGRAPVGRKTRAAGLLVIHQAPPTARGMRFLTLEDEFGFINVVVRQEIYDRYRRTIRTHRLLLAEGTLQRRHTVTNLIASRVLPLKVME